MSELDLEEGSAGESLSIRDYLLVVQRHRLLILLVALGVTVVAVLYSSTRTPVYQSRSELLVQPFQRIEQAPLTTAGGSVSLATELRLITSAPVRDRVAAQLGLAPSDPRLLRVQVSQITGTSIVAIVATDQDPVIAASVSNAYATSYLDSRRDRVLSSVVTARRALDAEITELEQGLADVDRRIEERQAGRGELAVSLREELTDLRLELDAVRQRRGDVTEDPASRLALVQGRIIVLDARLRTLEEEVVELDAEIAELVAGLPGSTLTDPRIRLSDELERLLSERDFLAALTSRSPAQDARLAALPGLIDGVQRRIVSVSNLQFERDRRLGELSRAGNERNALVRDEGNLTPATIALLAQLDEEIEVLEAEIRTRELEIERILDTPTVDVSSLRLERDVLFSRLSSFIGQRAALVEDASGLTDGGEVLVRGGVPTSPISPQPARAGLLALMVGIALGVAIAFARDYLEDAIRDDLDVRRATGRRPLLGRIPEWVIPGPTRDGIVTLLDPSSVAAESYRELSANVRFMALSRPMPGTEGAVQAAAGALAGVPLDAAELEDRPPLGRGVMLVSPTANNGKTATAVNLAVASARAGQRVVIVDADLRRPRVATLFGLGRLRGLSDLLAERGNVDDYLVNVGVPNLLVLPAGTLPPNPADVLAAAQLDVIYRELQRRFDLILIDTPAILAVPDALEVGRLTDWALLVMQHTVSTRREVTGTIERLEQVGVRIDGSVLNAIDTRSDAYYYYYTYYHRLEYGAAGDGLGLDGTLGGAQGSGPRMPVGAAPRERVLVPAAPARGGMASIARLNPFRPRGGARRLSDGDYERR
jgi:capsular exopolysaccharide synthesis family protein